MLTTTVPFHTTGELASVLGVQGWQVARLFESGELPEPARLAGRRVIPRAMIPEVVKALERHGWLPVAEEAAK
jgi:hypothetical protein